MIQHFFQLCFDTGQIPTLLTKAIIVRIPKGGNKHLHVLLNYRGISLLCNAGKLYSSLLNIRLSEYLETNYISHHEQNGFLPNRSCEHHIFALTSIIRSRPSNKLDTFAIFVDLQTAFDFCDWNLLFSSYFNYEIEGKMYFAIKSLLNKTESCIKINEILSDFFQVCNGVRRGNSILTTLFSLFINDLLVQDFGID